MSAERPRGPMPMLIGSAAGRLAVLACLAFVSPAALARDIKAGALVIGHPWARATPGGAEVGGGYLTIANTGRTPDRLVGGSFEASAGFALHAMSMDGGVMRMRPIGPLDIPAGSVVTLSPAGQHIMFTGLKRPLAKGETIGGTLVFEHAGPVPVTFSIEGIGAKGPVRDPASGTAPNAMPGMSMD